MLDYLTILTRKITILIINTCAVNTGSSSRFSLLILLYIILFIYIITLVTAGILLYKEISKNIKQKLENEHLEIYSQEYKYILKTVQARQHEFNNHINNIINMHFIYKNYEDLTKHQEEYAGFLKESYKYNKLLDTNQPAISGFLYMKMCQYERVNAEIIYNIDVTDISKYISIVEMAEIAGALLDNSFQALEKLPAGIPRKLEFTLAEDEEILSLKIKNTLESKINYKTLSCFFKEDYSTKGEGHGMGLFNVQNIMKHGNGDISIHSYYDNGFWISICCSIKKKLSFW